jgi:hypothetical protein
VLFSCYRSVLNVLVGATRREAARREGLVVVASHGVARCAQLD